MLHVHTYYKLSNALQLPSSGNQSELINGIEQVGASMSVHMRDGKQAADQVGYRKQANGENKQIGANEQVGENAQMVKNKHMKTRG